MPRKPKLEKNFSDKLASILKAMPCSWWHKPITGSVRGIPDWIGCVRGRFVSLELKKVGARVDKKRETLQGYIADAIIEARGTAFRRVTEENWPVVKKYLEEMV